MTGSLWVGVGLAALAAVVAFTFLPKRASVHGANGGTHHPPAASAPLASWSDGAGEPVLAVVGSAAATAPHDARQEG